MTYPLLCTVSGFIFLVCLFGETCTKSTPLMTLDLSRLSLNPDASEIASSPDKTSHEELSSTSSPSSQSEGTDPNGLTAEGYSDVDEITTEISSTVAPAESVVRKLPVAAGKASRTSLPAIHRAILRSEKFSQNVGQLEETTTIPTAQEGKPSKKSIPSIHLVQPTIKEQSPANRLPIEEDVSLPLLTSDEEDTRLMTKEPEETTTGKTRAPKLKENGTSPSRAKARPSTKNMTGSSNRMNSGIKVTTVPPKLNNTGSPSADFAVSDITQNGNLTDQRIANSSGFVAFSTNKKNGKISKNHAVEFNFSFWMIGLAISVNLMH